MLKQNERIDALQMAPFIIIQIKSTIYSGGFFFNEVNWENNSSSDQQQQTRGNVMLFTTELPENKILGIRTGSSLMRTEKFAFSFFISSPYGGRILPLTEQGHRLQPSVITTYFI